MRHLVVLRITIMRGQEEAARKHRQCAKGGGKSAATRELTRIGSAATTEKLENVLHGERTGKPFEERTHPGKGARKEKGISKIPLRGVGKHRIRVGRRVKE